MSRFAKASEKLPVIVAPLKVAGCFALGWLAEQGKLVAHALKCLEEVPMFYHNYFLLKYSQLTLFFVSENSIFLHTTNNHH